MPENIVQVSFISKLNDMMECYEFYFMLQKSLEMGLFLLQSSYKNQKLTLVYNYNCLI